ncbi:MAG: hypothetical protein ACO3FE_08215 [Planctomycetaceae bacterium]
MSLTERLAEYVRACFSGIWIESHEHQDALVAISSQFLKSLQETFLQLLTLFDFFLACAMSLLAKSR